MSVWGSFAFALISRPAAAPLSALSKQWCGVDETKWAQRHRESNDSPRIWWPRRYAMISLYFIKKSLVLCLPAISSLLCCWLSNRKTVTYEFLDDERRDIVWLVEQRLSTAPGPTNGVNIVVSEANFVAWSIQWGGGSNVVILDDDDDCRKFTTPLTVESESWLNSRMFEVTRGL